MSTEFMKTQIKIRPRICRARNGPPRELNGSRTTIMFAGTWDGPRISILFAARCDSNKIESNRRETAIVVIFSRVYYGRIIGEQRCIVRVWNCVTKGPRKEEILYLESTNRFHFHLLFSSEKSNFISRYRSSWFIEKRRGMISTEEFVR